MLMETLNKQEQSFGIIIKSMVLRAEAPSARGGGARNWSAHGHIHSEVRNKLAPATTEKLVYIYSNRKAVAAAARDDELKMFTWDNE